MVLHLLGNYYWKIRSFNQAEKCYSEALEEKRKHYPPIQLEIARTLYQLGKTKYRLAGKNYRYPNSKRLKEAIMLLQEALNIKQQYYTQHVPSNILDTLVLLGKANEKLGEKEKALAYYNQAKKIEEQSYRTPYIDSHYHLARLHFITANREKALQVLKFNPTPKNKAKRLHNEIIATSDILPYFKGCKLLAQKKASVIRDHSLKNSVKFTTTTEKSGVISHTRNYRKPK
jgi:tetratricopeptide (TPR) repeat protein